MKIVVVSDNHGRKQVLDKVIIDNSDADYFIHCGDSELPKEMLRGFLAVRGNNDFTFDLPEYKILEVENYRILVLHGHRLIYMQNREMLINRAKAEKCNIVCFGHSHIFESMMIDGIQLINPGSLWQNRDGTKPSYAILELNNNSIKIRRINI